MPQTKKTRSVEARVTRVVTEFGSALTKLAERYSLCWDDALDAYQRALEIYVRRIETVDAATEFAWLKVIVRREALAIRQLRQESVDREEVDFDEYLREGQLSMEEKVQGEQKVVRSLDAIRRLKQDEARALVLQAEGHSHTEIGGLFGWTQTKVNRCITEGRQRFLKIYGGLESGVECERFQRTVLALAAGRATKVQILEIRPHLRHCCACRAQVRLIRGRSRWQKVAALLPIPAFTINPLRWAGERLGFGAVRVAGSDVGQGLTALAGGGGRATTVAALVGICVTGAGGYCLTNGVPDPGRLVGSKSHHNHVAGRPASPELLAPQGAVRTSSTVSASQQGKGKREFLGSEFLGLPRGELSWSGGKELSEEDKLGARNPEHGSPEPGPRPKRVRGKGANKVKSGKGGKQSKPKEFGNRSQPKQPPRSPKPPSSSKQGRAPNTSGEFGYSGSPAQGNEF